MAMKLTYRSGAGTSRYWQNESSIGSIVDGKDVTVKELKFNSSNNRWEMTNNDGEVLAYNSYLKLDGWTSSYSYNLRFPAEYTPEGGGASSAGNKLQVNITDSTKSYYNGTYTLVDPNMTGYDRVWLNDNDSSHCIRYLSWNSQWAFCTAWAGADPSIQDFWTYNVIISTNTADPWGNIADGKGTITKI